MRLTIKQELSRRYWVARSRVQRYGRAWRYATGRMTEWDGLTMRHECEDVTGYYGLEGLSREVVLGQAIDRYGDHPALPALADQACSRVAHKWCGDGHVADAAEAWAMDLIAEYAREDGVTLIDQWDAAALVDA